MSPGSCDRCCQCRLRSTGRRNFWRGLPGRGLFCPLRCNRNSEGDVVVLVLVVVVYEISSGGVVGVVEVVALYLCAEWIEGGEPAGGDGGKFVVGAGVFRTIFVLGGACND